MQDVGPGGEFIGSQGGHPPRFGNGSGGLGHDVGGLDYWAWPRRSGVVSSRRWRRCTGAVAGYY
jgi:hypothetical protein